MQFVRATILLFMLLNPFLMVIYIIDYVHDADKKEFLYIIMKAGTISFIVFSIFVKFGYDIFALLLQAEFESFQIFGGIIFLILGVRYVFRGQKAFRFLRGNKDNVAASLAMPLMIGPGSISASVIAGKMLGFYLGVLAVFTSVFVSVVVLYVLKITYDYVKPRNERLIDRYVEIMGRIAALIVGTFAIEMIMEGVQVWLGKIL